MIFFRADIALIGLAVMGQNLILNMNDHGFVVCNVYVPKCDCNEYYKLIGCINHHPKRTAGAR